MWTATLKERQDGAADVSATYTEVDGQGNQVGEAFTYSAVIKKADAATFVADCKKHLAIFQARQGVVADITTQLEALLNA